MEDSISLNDGCVEAASLDGGVEAHENKVNPKKRRIKRKTFFLVTILAPFRPISNSTKLIQPDPKNLRSKQTPIHTSYRRLGS